MISAGEMPNTRWTLPVPAASVWNCLLVFWKWPASFCSPMLAPQGGYRCISAWCLVLQPLLLQVVVVASPGRPCCIRIMRATRHKSKVTHHRSKVDSHLPYLPITHGIAHPPKADHHLHNMHSMRTTSGKPKVCKPSQIRSVKF